MMILETDVSVYSELLLPCLNYNSVNSHNTGLGKYNVLIQQNAWTSSAEQKQVSGSIDKGVLTLFNPSDIARPVSNAFAWTINQHDISKSMAQTQKEMLEDYLKENPGETEEGEYDLFQDEAIAKQHFISLLQYLHDHNDFLAMMDAATGDFSEEVDYSGKIRYLKNHDLKVYGVATLADKNTLLEILKNDNVYSIGTEPY